MVQQQDLYISRRGLEELKQELKQLLVQRKEIVTKIKEAREFGDLSENAEYLEAKNKQSFIEGRIAEVETMLKMAKVIDENNRTGGRVALGSQIKIKINGEVREYTLTGSNETNPGTGRISNESPIGQALLGHKRGDIVKINTPEGVKEYKIISIR